MYKKQIIGIMLAFFAFIALVYIILQTMLQGGVFDSTVTAGIAICVVSMIIGGGLVVLGERELA